MTDTLWQERKAIALIANRLLREGYTSWPEVIEVAQRVRAILTKGTSNDSVRIE